MLKNGRKKSGGEEEVKKTSLVASQSFGSSYSLSREMGDLSLGEDDGTEVGLKRRRDSEAGRSGDTSVVAVGWPRNYFINIIIKMEYSTVVMQYNKMLRFVNVGRRSVGMLSA
jgi:hypothetical protein